MVSTVTVVVSMVSTTNYWMLIRVLLLKKSEDLSHRNSNKAQQLLKSFLKSFKSNVIIYKVAIILVMRIYRALKDSFQFVRN